MRNLVFTLCAAALISLFGCTTTVVREPVTSSQPSWDGAEQNSGVIAIADDGWLIVTPHFIDRYKALVLRYGKEFVPPLDTTSGIEQCGLVWRMDPQHASYFYQMNRWRKEGR